MYSKFFIYRVIICTIPLIFMDILLYIIGRKQVKLLIQAFKRNGFREINNLFNIKYVFLIIFFMILIAIRLMR